jgi:pyruvate dehydrogenase E2 component (dihydrolipoamide acetyltransferase)
MITEVVMPQMGADMKEGTVLRWLKQEGSEVERGEIIAEIETDKANIEIEAFGGGIFRKAIAMEGDVVPVGTVIAVIGAPDDDISKYESGAVISGASPAYEAPATTQAAAPSSEPVPSTTEAPSQPPPTTVPSKQPAPAAPQAGTAVAEPASDERLRVTPVARRIATERGIDLRMLRGSGPDGRILRRDVEAAEAVPVAAAPRTATTPPATYAPAPRGVAGQDSVQDITPSRMRATIARRTQQSKQQVPHYYLGMSIDMTEALALRKQLNETLGDQAKISINDVVVLATARALAQHPKLNAYWVDDHVQLHSQINIGIAVAMDDGLVAPAVMDVGNKGLLQISAEARDVAARARSGNLTPEEYSAATFNISNGGVFGIDEIIPIITQPQVGVLGVGAANETPVARDGEVVVRSMMYVSLAADHRATDGADGAKFLQTLKRLLEQPGLMLL